MAAAFDPYEKWLGISPSEQPPNFYRLLGVELFESDRQTIDAAAKRHMRNLQAEVAGPNGPIARQLLVEISDARICLMMPDRRKAYDHGLRAGSALAKPAPQPVAAKQPTLSAKTATSAPKPAAPAEKAPAEKARAVEAPALAKKPATRAPEPVDAEPELEPLVLESIGEPDEQSSLDSLETLEFADADEPVEMESFAAADEEPMELEPIDEADDADTVTAEADEIVELESIGDADHAGRDRAEEEAVELEPADETEEPVELEAEVAEDDVAEMAEDAVELEPADEADETVELEAMETDEADAEAAEPDEEVTLEAFAEEDEPVELEDIAEDEEPVELEAAAEEEVEVALEAVAEEDEPVELEDIAADDEPVELENFAEEDEPVELEAAAEPEEPVHLESAAELDEAEPHEPQPHEIVHLEAVAADDEPVELEAAAEDDEPVELEAAAEPEEAVELEHLADEHEPISLEPISLEPLAEDADPIELFFDEPAAETKPQPTAPPQPVAKLAAAPAEEKPQSADIAWEDALGLGDSTNGHDTSDIAHGHKPVESAPLHAGAAAAEPTVDAASFVDAEPADALSDDAVDVFFDTEFAAPADVATTEPLLVTKAKQDPIELTDAVELHPEESHEEALHSAAELHPALDLHAAESEHAVELEPDLEHIFAAAPVARQAERAEPAVAMAGPAWHGEPEHGEHEHGEHDDVGHDHGEHDHAGHDLVGHENGAHDESGADDGAFFSSMGISAVPGVPAAKLAGAGGGSSAGPSAGRSFGSATAGPGPSRGPTAGSPYPNFATKSAAPQKGGQKMPPRKQPVGQRPDDEEEEVSSWMPGGWKVPAIVGGGVMIVIVALVIVAMNNQDEPPAPPRPAPRPAAPVVNTPQRREGVQSGASVLQGPIDDRTTSSPLGNQKSIKVPLERHGDLLLAAVKVDGVDAGKFLIDTGVRDTIFSTELADRLKLVEKGRTSLMVPGGKQSASKRKFQSLTLGAVTFKDTMLIPMPTGGDWLAIAVDMKPWSAAVGEPIAGVIGCEIISQMPVTIDARNKLITFSNRHNQFWSPGDIPFMTTIGDLPCYGASLDHGREQQGQYFALATGCATDLLLKPAKGEADVKAGSLGFFGREFGNPTTAALTPDSVYYVADKFGVPDPRQVGVIGARILDDYQLLLDFEHNKMMAIPNKTK